MGIQSIFIRDETFGSTSDPTSFTLKIEASDLTVADVIRERVRYEVDRYNRDRDAKAFSGLVRPSEMERRLNAPRKGIDLAAQIEAALKGYSSNAYILLIDDDQVDDLQARVRVHPDMKVTFLKLVPLVGG